MSLGAGREDGEREREFMCVPSEQQCSCLTVRPALPCWLAYSSYLFCPTLCSSLYPFLAGWILGGSCTRGLWMSAPPSSTF